MIYVQTNSLKDQKYILNLSLWTTNCDHYRAFSMSTSHQGSCVWCTSIRSRMRKHMARSQQWTPALIQTLSYHKGSRRPKCTNSDRTNMQKTSRNAPHLKLHWILCSSMISHNPAHCLVANRLQCGAIYVWPSATAPWKTGAECLSQALVWFTLVMKTAGSTSFIRVILLKGLYLG